MANSGVQKFEDRRWQATDQKVVWRHQAGLQLVNKEPVLDVGGGDGLFLDLLRNHKGFTNLTLVDISPVAIQKALTKNIRSLIWDATAPLPFEDNEFATSCGLDFLEHLYDPLFALKELARVSHEVVIVVPNFHYWKERLHMCLGKIPFQCKPKRGHVHWFNYDILLNLIKNTGMHLDEILYDGFKRLGPIGNWLARCYPNLFSTSFAVRLKKS